MSPSEAKPILHLLRLISLRLPQILEWHALQKRGTDEPLQRIAISCGNIAAIRY